MAQLSPDKRAVYDVLVRLKDEYSIGSSTAYSFMQEQSDYVKLADRLTADLNLSRRLSVRNVAHLCERTRNAVTCHLQFISARESTLKDFSVASKHRVLAHHEQHKSHDEIKAKDPVTGYHTWQLDYVLVLRDYFRRYFERKRNPQAGDENKSEHQIRFETLGRCLLELEDTPVRILHHLELLKHVSVPEIVVNANFRDANRERFSEEYKRVIGEASPGTSESERHALLAMALCKINTEQYEISLTKPIEATRSEVTYLYNPSGLYKQALSELTLPWQQKQREIAIAFLVRHREGLIQEADARLLVDSGAQLAIELINRSVERYEKLKAKGGTPRMLSDERGAAARYQYIHGSIINNKRFLAKYFAS